MEAILPSVDPLIVIMGIFLVLGALQRLGLGGVDAGPPSDESRSQRRAEQGSGRKEEMQLHRAEHPM
eukprot:3220208-Amphidinium_carterae.1